MIAELIWRNSSTTEAVFNLRLLPSCGSLLHRLSPLELGWFRPWNRLRSRILALLGPPMKVLPAPAHFHWNHWKWLHCWSRIQLSKLHGNLSLYKQNIYIFKKMIDFVWKFTAINIVKCWKWFNLGACLICSYFGADSTGGSSSFYLRQQVYMLQFLA